MPPLHTARSIASPLFRPRSLMSFATHSNHFFFPLPTPLAPSTTKSLHLDTQSSPLFRSTLPNQLNLHRLIRSHMHTIPMQSSNSSDDLRSFRDTPHIHLTIILSVLIIRCTSPTFKAQVSLPYTNTLCTQAEYSFPF